MDADMSPAAAGDCLRNRTLIFMGDSNTRDFGIAMASFLSGVTPELAEDFKFDKDRTWTYADALTQRRGFFGRKPTSSADARSHSRDPIYADGFVDPRHGWRVRVVQGYHHTVWPKFLNLTDSANPDDTILFVNLGVHAATSKSIQHQWGTEAKAAQHMTHGYVMQPFLDHYCRAHLNAARGGSSGGSAEAGLERAIPVPRSERSPATLAWMTHNDQCYVKKKQIYWPQHWPLIHANQAARKAAADLRYPLLDWSFISRDNASVVCELSDDGVHYRQWVDHVRARLLSALLCRHGRARPPVANPPTATSSSPTLAERSSRESRPAAPAPSSSLQKVERPPGTPTDADTDAGAMAGAGSLQWRAVAAASVAAFNASLARCTSCELPKVWIGAFGASGDALLENTADAPGGTGSEPPRGNGSSVALRATYCKNLVGDV